MPRPPAMLTTTPRKSETASTLVEECRAYLDWEERRLASILKCLCETRADGASSPFDVATSQEVWDPSPGMIRRERIKELIHTVCDVKSSNGTVTVLMGRIPAQDVASLQERRDTVRGLAQAVHSAARGWMRQVALMELGVECTLQELTGGNGFTVSYDDHGQVSTSSPQPVINFRT